MNYKFPKTEKLRLKKDIEELFKHGKKSFSYPISLFVLEIPESGTNLCAVSAPKKKLKKAVDRNRVKRQMREAYRLNKYKIENEHKHFKMMFVYSISEMLDYNQIENAIIKLIEKLNHSK